MTKPFELNPKLDLVLERVFDAPKDLVWEAWTRAEHLKRWFVPRPWSIAHCEVDLRPGGIFRTVMRSPDGTDHDNSGCYLEIVRGEKIVWTSALAPGFRPAPQPINGPELFFTAMILFEPHGDGTKLTAIAIHGDEASHDSHEKMGFKDGWGTCLDQMAELLKAGEIA